MRSCSGMIDVEVISLNIYNKSLTPPFDINDRNSAMEDHRLKYRYLELRTKELQTNYFHKYNTSLNGLLIHHDVKAEEFLEYVHDIDLEFMEKDIVLREELLKLDAKKFVFTNGSHGHVKQITKHLGIDDLFNGTFAITDSNYVPKPELTVYNKLCNIGLGFYGLSTVFQPFKAAPKVGERIQSDTGVRHLVL